MLTAEARVQTSDPARYVAQLCKHAAAMGEHGPALFRRHMQQARAHAGGGALMRGEVHLSAECSATQGVITLVPWGRCTVSVDADSLLLCVESNDTASLSRIQGVVTSDLERWGARENLKVVWSTPDPYSEHSTVAGSMAANAPDADAQRREPGPSGRHRMLLVTGGALGVAVIVLVHMTLAGVIVSVPLWLGWTAAGVMLVPALTLLVHAVGPLTIIGLLRHTFRRAQPRPAAHIAVSTQADGHPVAQRRHTSESPHL